MENTVSPPPPAAVNMGASRHYSTEQSLIKTLQLLNIMELFFLVFPVLNIIKKNKSCCVVFNINIYEYLSATHFLKTTMHELIAAGLGLGSALP